MSEILVTSVATPIGPFSVATLDGVVIESTFGSPRRLRNKGKVVFFIPGVSIPIRRYFSGDHGALDSIPVRIEGSSYKTKVLKQMRRVRAGTVISYKSLAAKSGSTRASRAVGSACSTNLIPLIIPCHRVLPSSGGVGNYGYGVKRKKWLLEFEGINEQRVTR